MFFKGSRYEGVATVTIVDERGRDLRYKVVRLIPDSRPLYGYAVLAAERLDTIAFEVFNDPERFWRICDANRTMWPAELTSRPGTIIGIPGAEG
jgi:hypothetical protein